MARKFKKKYSPRSESAEERFMFYVMPEPNSGCWFWMGSCKAKMPYGNLKVRGKTEIAHRVSYRLFVGEIPANKIVRHRCDIPLCVNPEHLELGTHKENARDRDFRGRANSLRGENHPHTKLTDSIVLEIRRLWKIGGRRQSEIASLMGVTKSIVQRVCSRKVWGHVA